LVRIETAGVQSPGVCSSGYTGTKGQGGSLVGLTLSAEKAQAKAQEEKSSSSKQPSSENQLEKRREKKKNKRRGTKPIFCPPSPTQNQKNLQNSGVSVTMVGCLEY
jgi:hypothetical protein